ncbi:hypothetical protein BDV95DRAFT_218592 [Massariosphaeria phaeospora]|uniref:Uncharacterized protein n=1 Tax=Massariosphaeria phaeospora TaxID=100035 RepID=A0A7C8ICK6_9PLEO|nr:hypothetical protein BDV95DRAFT_218592 [Massariosphaeria phaeospora]
MESLDYFGTATDTGKPKSVIINYGTNGRSLGTAMITFFKYQLDCCIWGMNTGKPKLVVIKSTDWDEVFQSKLLALIARFREEPRAGGLTQKDLKEFIDKAYSEIDEMLFAGRPLSDNQINMRAMTKVFTITSSTGWTAASGAWTLKPQTRGKGFKPL